MLRTQCLARNCFLCIQYNELQTPTVSNVNSDCLYSELLRFPSIIDPWEDRILPQPAGETHTEGKESKKEKKKRKAAEERECTKKLKSLPSGERLSGAFTRFLSDEPSEDKSEALSLSPRCLAEGEILSAPWSESTLYDRQTGRHRRWQALLSKWGKNKVGWLSSVKLMAGPKVSKESRYQNLVGYSRTLPIIELKALLNISFVLWELDSWELSKS